MNTWITQGSCSNRFWFSSSGWGLGLGISNELPGVAEAASPRPTPRVASLRSVVRSSVITTWVVFTNTHALFSEICSHGSGLGPASLFYKVAHVSLLCYWCWRPWPWTSTTGTCLSPWVTESTDVVQCVPGSCRDVRRRIGEIIMTAPSAGSRVQDVCWTSEWNDWSFSHGVYSGEWLHPRALTTA